MLQVSGVEMSVLGTRPLPIVCISAVRDRFSYHLVVVPTWDSFPKSGDRNIDPNILHVKSLL